MIELAEEKTRKKNICNTCLLETSVEDYHPEAQFDKVISSFMIPHVKPHLRPIDIFVHVQLFETRRPCWLVCVSR